MSDKTRSLALLAFAATTAMSLWFVSSAALPDMLRLADISPVNQALLSSSVQAGFVVGALLSAILGIADRYDPRRVFAYSAFLAVTANTLLLAVPVGEVAAIMLRFATGFLLAGVYPVGMKIVVGWGTKDRGFLIGLLVGALTLGSAMPHLASLFGGTNWRLAILITSAFAASGGAAVLFTTLGPHHARSPAFNPRAIFIAWTNRNIRTAYLGYFGHMWELYAMWSWIGVVAAASFAASMPLDNAQSFAKLTAFAAIGIGGPACVLAGIFADRIGKAEVTVIAMGLSAAAGFATALTFGGAPWITFVLAVLWGATIVPDSAQFSALVADNAPPELAGSLMSLQTSLGFLLTFFTVQATPIAAVHFGWPPVLFVLAIGPLFGVFVMRRLTRWA